MNNSNTSDGQSKVAVDGQAIKKLDEDLKKLQKEAEEELKKNRNQFADTQSTFPSEEPSEGFYRPEFGQVTEGKRTGEKNINQPTAMDETLQSKDVNQEMKEKETPQEQADNDRTTLNANGFENDNKSEEIKKEKREKEVGSSAFEKPQFYPEVKTDNKDINFTPANPTPAPQVPINDTKKDDKKDKNNKSGGGGKTFLVVFLVLLLTSAASFISYYLGTRNSAKTSPTPRPTLASRPTPTPVQMNLNTFTSLNGKLSFMYPNDLYLYSEPDKLDVTIYTNEQEIGDSTISILVKDNPENISITEWINNDARESAKEILAPEEEMTLTNIKLTDSEIDWMTFGEIRPALASSGEIYWAGKTGDKIVLVGLNNLDFSQYRQTVEKILESMMLTANEPSITPSPNASASASATPQPTSTP